jgi:hypothetical protein
MQTLSRRDLLASLFVLPVSSYAGSSAQADGWIPLFDGKSLDGWKASGQPGSFKAIDGQIAADGPRSHLFYSGPVRNADFKNFELRAEVMARPLANSGVYFHTAFQSDGFPQKGFEIQVNNTALGEGSYRERKKTGSLYAIRNVYKQFVPDDEWFRLLLSVRGKQIQVRLNEMLLVDFVEADPPVIAQGSERGRFIDHGTFALQCHDPGSKAFFRNLMVRPLPDDAKELSTERPVVDDVYRQIINLGAKNFPVVDYHVHLKSGWTLDQALANSRRVGIQYGLAVNCGKGFGVTNDAGIRDYIASLKGQPVFVAMQAEGREWVKMFSRDAVAQFDYVFSDAMTFTDDRGKRMRLWIKEEVGEIGDKDAFMNVIVDRILGVLNNEPIDIYVNPTFLPEVMSADYDRLWTPERMSKVIDAAKKNDIAIEINNRYRIPSPAFIKLAKQAGAKFSFGTNNTDANIGRLEYPLAMVSECGLTWQDIFIPKPDGKKPVQVRGL